jgi:parallel beta-helix repeat protein
MNLRRTIAVASASAVLLGLAVETPAAASHLTCGQVVRSSTTLDSDLFCPNGDGLVVEGNGVTLNLGGHTIRGELETRTVSQPAGFGDNGVLGAPYTVRFARGQFVGVRVRGTGNTVTGPGTIRNFAAGVVVEGGSRHTVTRLLIDENLGPAGSEDLGDGILLRASRETRVTANTVRNNGPYSGITLLGAAERNSIVGNRVVDNKQPEVCPAHDVFRFSSSGGGVLLFCGPSHPTRRPFTYVNQQNMGIKLEGQDFLSTRFNNVSGNVVTGSGNSGIFVPSHCPDFGLPGSQCPGEPNRDNNIVGNQVNRNGFGVPTGVPVLSVFQGPSNGGSGIVLLIGGPKPPIRHVVSGNTANENAADGITVFPFAASGSGMTQSVFFGNTALRNNAAPVPGGFPAFNALDGNATFAPNAPCDANIWRSNNFGRTAADIHGPVPPNNLTNHPCVGPQLPAGSAQAADAAGPQARAAADVLSALSRHGATRTAGG